MSKRIQHQLFLTAGLIGGGLLIIALFWDLPISNALINENSLFGTIFQTFGEFAVYLIFVLSGQIAMTYAWRHRRDWLFASLLFFGGFGLSAWQLKQYLNEIADYALAAFHNIAVHQPIGLANSDATTAALPLSQALLLWLVVYLGLTGLIQFWLHRQNDQQLTRYLLVGIFASLTVWFALEVNLVLKADWGRVRPYELNHAQSNFTTWLHPNGVNGHKSFPSGHAMAGTLSIVFSWFAVKPRLHRILWVSGVVYAILLAISRLIIGAHFLSDVTFSFLLTAAIIYIMRELYYRLVSKPLQL